MVSTPPATRAEAAAVLQRELTAHGLHMRGVHATESELFWEADTFLDPAPPGSEGERWIPNTLGFDEIRGLSDITSHGGGWQLQVDARGGRVRLWLDSRDSGLKVRAALERMTKP